MLFSDSGVPPKATMHPYQNPFGLNLSLGERIRSFWVTMGGFGMIPWGPGTWGSLLGVGLYMLAGNMSLHLKVGIIIAVFFLSIWMIEGLQRMRVDVQDASWIVIDEGVGIWIALLGWDGSLSMLIALFVLFRLLDIFKPFPISAIDEKGHTGLFVMLDDVLAGVFTWSLIYILSMLRVFV